MATETNLERGMRAEEAHRAALRSFGNLGRIGDLAYEVRGGGMLDTLWQDLRYASRMLRKNPGFTIVATLTLALGIGANTAIFSVINAVLLRPLPYPQSDRLMWISERSPNFPVMSISYLNFADWRARQTVFEHIGVYRWDTYNLVGARDPVRLSGVRMSADSFAALRVQPALGRLFDNDEDKPGGAECGCAELPAMAGTLFRRSVGP